MNILSSTPIQDKCINAMNIIVEMPLGEYYDLVKDVMVNNDFQRARVRSAKNIYALLKRDLISGCMVPPIVLSIHKKIDKDEKITPELIFENKDSLMILDGLQRTYTIQDIVKDSEKDEEAKKALANPIRVEIYLGLNREGILYRMLTLNTGQTPMKLRHQVEIIYSNLLINQPEGYTLIKDVDEKQEVNASTFRFSEAVDAFTSYIEQDYLQITRESLLENIKSFDELMKISKNNNIFNELLLTYSKFIQKVDEAIGEEYVRSQEFDFSENPFGKNAISIFNKSQALTGFGAAVSKLMSLEAYRDIQDLIIPINELDDADIRESIVPLLENLNSVRYKSKKIGNSQRGIF